MDFGTPMYRRLLSFGCDDTFRIRLGSIAWPALFMGNALSLFDGAAISINNRGQAMEARRMLNVSLQAKLSNHRVRRVPSFNSPGVYVVQYESNQNTSRRRNSTTVSVNSIAKRLFLPIFSFVLSSRVFLTVHLVPPLHLFSRRQSLNTHQE